MMKKKIGLILYARMSSKRYPGKVLTLIKNKILLDIIIMRVRKKFKNMLIIVNTSTNKSDEPIVDFCEKRNIKYFRGSLKNVFKRTIDCCKKFELDYFIRICSERPLIDSSMVYKMYKILKKKNNYDLITNQFPRTVPIGLSCEIAKSTIFTKINPFGLSKSSQEHIFDHFYKNSKKYKIFNYSDNFYNKLINIKLSLDTKSDFLRIKKIYKKINYNFLLETKKIIKKTNKI